MQKRRRREDETVRNDILDIYLPYSSVNKEGRDEQEREREKGG